MAQAFFKSWFVDFDPVRAKMEGREPAGMDAETAALFPDGFEVVDGRECVGWRVVPLPEAIEINPRISLRKGDSAPYLDMKNMPMQAIAPLNGWSDLSALVSSLRTGTLSSPNYPLSGEWENALRRFSKRWQVGWGSTEYIVLRPKPPLPRNMGIILQDLKFFGHIRFRTCQAQAGVKEPLLLVLIITQLLFHPRRLQSNLRRLLNQLCCLSSRRTRIPHPHRPP
jgi:type I restriction enzyme S subunit